MLLASWTIQLCILFLFLLVKYKSEFAVGSGTPRYILLHIDRQVKREGAKFFILFSIKQVFQVAVTYLTFALWVWTEDWELGLCYLGFQVHTKAFIVEDMFTELKGEDRVLVFELVETNFAIKLIHLFLFLVFSNPQ